MQIFRLGAGREFSIAAWVVHLEGE
jgi:hypothetical protein